MEKEKSVTNGAMHVKVKMLDWTNIEKKITDIYQKHTGKDDELFVRGTKGIVDFSEQEILDNNNWENNSDCSCALIDNEAVGCFSTIERVFENDDIKVNEFVEIHLYAKERREGDRIYIGMFPLVSVKINVEDLVYTGEELLLYEYMGERYNYNDRISENEFSLLKEVFNIKDNKYDREQFDWRERFNISVEC